MKRCSKCGIEKDESEFYKDKYQKSGITSNCKTCYKEYNNNHKEKYLDYQRRHYAENKDVINLQRHEHYLRNRDQTLKKHKKYRDENKPKIAEYHKKYYIENREYILEKCKEYNERKRKKAHNHGSV